MDKKNILIIILVLLVIILLGTNVYFFNSLFENSEKDAVNSQVKIFHETSLKNLSNTFNAVIDGTKEEQEFLYGQYDPVADLSHISGTTILSKSYPELYVNYVSKLEKTNNRKRCEWVCGVATEYCFIAILNLSTIPNGSFQQCIHLPMYTSFVDEEMGCNPIEGYSIVDPLTEFDFGNYIFKDITPIGKTYPTICTYYKSE